MEATHLIISDLDGTLLGDDEALRQFGCWASARRQSLRLAYSSGRFVESVRESIKDTPLPEPDAIIGNVGTDIYLYPAGKRLEAWHQHIGVNWDAERARATLRDISGLRPQPDECQSSYKVSYFFEGAQPDDLAHIKRRLKEAGVEAELVYSSNRDLDVLPARANKGTAAAFLARTWEFDPQRVIVCGDSGNDRKMFEHGFRGIVVANAHDELQRLDGDNIYHARRSFAAGVLEGISHWLGPDA
jgi:sucrose phosphatase-like protein